MINSSMSKCTVEDSKAKVLFFLNMRNNFHFFFGERSINKGLKIPHIQFIGNVDPSLKFIFV